MIEITLPATLDSIERATDFVDEALSAQGCGAKAHMQINIAIDEIVGNIARYAYAPGSGSVTVRLEIADQTAALTFIDEGVAFNPLKASAPDVTLSAEERSIGGLGIFLVRKIMDSVSYERRDGKNILRLTKRL